MFGPIMDLRALMGIGPRVTKHTITSRMDEPLSLLRGHGYQGVT
jgi:hypothetical protein